MGIWYMERPVGAAKLKGTITCHKTHRIFLEKLTFHLLTAVNKRYSVNTVQLGNYLLTTLYKPNAFG